MHAQGGIKGEEKGNKGIDLAFVERLCGLREAVCESCLAALALLALLALFKLFAPLALLVPVSAR
jgi:hypothetical protein